MKNIKTTQVDLFDCNGLNKLDNNVICFFLDNLVKYINMRKIPVSLTGFENPNCFEFIPSKVKLDDVEHGFTGFILMYESHCAIHTWTLKNFVSITICSCKNYDQYQTAKFCASFFESVNYNLS